MYRDEITGANQSKWFLPFSLSSTLIRPFFLVSLFTEVSQGEGKN